MKVLDQRQVLLPSVDPIREENPWAGPNVNGQEPIADSGTAEESGWSRGEEWLSQINSQSTITNGTTTPPLGNQEGNNAVLNHHIPPLSQLRSASLGSTPNVSTGSTRDPMSSSWTTSNGTGGSTTAHLIGRTTNSTSSGTTGGDPFDAEWAALAARNANPNNPFLPNTVTKAFEVQM